MSEPFNLSKPNRTIHAGVILLNSETEILDVAPIDMLHGMSTSYAKDLASWFNRPKLVEQALDIQFHWVNESGDKARLTGGVIVEPTDTFLTCPPLDIVLMGAHSIRYTPTASELDFVRTSYEKCSAFMTICGGFQAAFLAGLFKGKTVTAPRFMLEQLRQMGPDTTWVAERWHRDGKLWTSGALLNGLDCMRAFVSETWEPEEGGLVHWGLEAGHWPVRDVGYRDAPTEL